MSLPEHLHTRFVLDRSDFLPFLSALHEKFSRFFRFCTRVLLAMEIFSPCTEGLWGPTGSPRGWFWDSKNFTVTNYHQIFHLCWVILASEILSCGLSGVYPPFVKWAENFSGGWRGFSSGADSVNSSRELLEETYKYCPWIPSNIEIVPRFNYSSLISPEIKGFSINTNPPKKTF